MPWDRGREREVEKDREIRFGEGEREVGDVSCGKVRLFSSASRQ